MPTKKSAKAKAAPKARKVVKKVVVKKAAPKTKAAFTPTKLKLVRPVPSDIDIAQAAKLKTILQVAEELGVRPNELELYGPYKAKIKLEILERLKSKPNGTYVDVTAITPTPLGEGKTTTTVGLSQALGAHLGRKVITAIRQRPLLSTLSGLNGYPFFVCLPRQQSAPRSLLNLDDFPDHWKAHAIVWRIVQNGPVYHL